MHNQVDLYVKAVLCDGFEGLGKAEQEVEVDAAAQRIDFYFAPSPEASREAWLGMPLLLAQLGREPCMVEHYHAPPPLESLRGCLRKQLTLHHRRRKREKSPQIAVLWLLSSKCSRKSLRRFAFERFPGWPPGVYRGPLPAVPYRMIVLSELPEVRETLALRLLGRGETFSRALTELLALPDDAWERVHMTPHLLQYRVPTSPKARAAFKEDGVEKEILMTSQEFVQQIENRGAQREREKAAEGFMHLFERQLSRPMTEAERATLHARYDTIGPARLGDVVMDLRSEQLAAWLADPNAK